eukprot:4749203-Heterocapsa_arctica.AAC.1
MSDITVKVNVIVVVVVVVVVVLETIGGRGHERLTQQRLGSRLAHLSVQLAGLDRHLLLGLDVVWDQHLETIG